MKKINKQELVEVIEALPAHNTRTRSWIDKKVVLGLVRQLDEPEKVVVPQFVADWIANVKRNGFKFRNSSRFYEEIVSSDDAYRVMYYILRESIAGEAIRIWVNANRDTFARTWLDGYEIEKEKRYEVILCNGQSLKTVYRQGEDRLDFEKEYGDLERFTRKQLEEANFGWVFDCPGIEIEEVKDE